MPQNLRTGFYIMNDHNMTYKYRIIGTSSNGKIVCETMFRKHPVNTYPVLTEIHIDIMTEFLSSGKFLLIEFDGDFIDTLSPREVTKYFKNL